MTKQEIIEEDIGALISQIIKHAPAVELQKAMIDELERQLKDGVSKEKSLKSVFGDNPLTFNVQ